jgi:hypothetical protein
MAWQRVNALPFILPIQLILMCRTKFVFSMAGGGVMAYNDILIQNSRKSLDAALSML